ncbi:CD83 antigen-like isoform X2 [Heterodontus francisci]|uniref:CD83 antigen-like isoform X2 n=1 Tax=Heterodontus francisci TaxID=7792 RepID=UPI00355AD968
MEFLPSCKLRRPLFLMPVLFILGAEAVTEVFVRLGERAKLSCDAPSKSEVQYRAISWYKVADAGFSLSGIVRKDFKENIVRKYLGFNGSVELASASPYFLTILNVSSDDLGTYQCSLWAPLGEQNKQADVRLRKRDDSNQSTRITMIKMLSIVTAVCVLSVLCMYLVYKKQTREIETCTKQIKEKIKYYSQPFGKKCFLYGNIQC